jgi:hypothetical protein
MSELKENDSHLRKELISLLTDLEPYTHGCSQLHGIRLFLAEELNKNKRKVIERAKFLTDIILRELICFGDVGSTVWLDPETREKNRFPFLQGDVVQTTQVQIVGDPLNSGQHDLWIVATPTCDILRSRFIRIFPIFLVKDSYQNGSGAEKNLFHTFALSMKLHSPKFFPLPGLPWDNPSIIGAFADFSSSPAFIERTAIGLAAPLLSLTLMGWHLFNAILQEHETRANMEDEKIIRGDRGH